jgi:pyruvate dehydrogenase E2 component (dihydrolipoamide acetyltransferase)
MEYNITVPHTADGALNVTILRWIKQPSSSVTKGEDLAEGKTEKINLNITSPATGILKQITAPVGTILRVGDVVGVVEGE